MLFIIRQFNALPFLPLHKIANAFSLLKEKSKKHIVLNGFVDCVFSTFVGDQYTSPMFPYTFWGVYQRVLDNIPRPRTNNAVEGWNNRFTQISGTRHPGFLVFVNFD